MRAMPEDRIVRQVMHPEGCPSCACAAHQALCLGASSRCIPARSDPLFVCCSSAAANLLRSGCVKVPDLFDFPIDNMKFGGKTYFLRGMVIHHGARLESGHYTACCRCSLPGAGDNKWYMFDDSRVSPVSEAELQNMQPYILFYCESSLTRQ